MNGAALNDSDTDESCWLVALLRLLFGDDRPALLPFVPDISRNKAYSLHCLVSMHSRHARLVPPAPTKHPSALRFSGVCSRSGHRTSALSGSGQEDGRE